MKSVSKSKNLRWGANGKTTHALHMWHTAIDDIKTVLVVKEEWCRDVEVKVGPRWSEEEAQRAIQVQQTWN